MTLHLYELDRKAQELVLKHRDADVLNESHKMRMTVAYGLERFWGEHLRLKIQSENSDSERRKQEARKKANYWKDTWDALVEMMAKGKITVPNDTILDIKDTNAIKRMAERLWDENNFSTDNRKIVLAVLTQLCDAIVWWSQRYKKVNSQ